MPRYHGHQLHVSVAGPEDGPVAVFIHSSGLSGRQWNRYAEAFVAAGYRVLVPDLIGQGESEPWRAEMPFHFHADLRAMEELVSEVAGPVTLVGHSYGGLLSLQLAAALPPDRLRALVVYEPVTWGVLHAEDERALASFREDGFFDDALGGTEEWTRRFVDYWSGEGAYDALHEAARAQMNRSARKTFEEVRSLCYDWTPARHYAGIVCPTLVMHGTRSPAEAQRICALVAAALPDATLRPIEGAGHLGAVQLASTLAPLVLEWAQQTDP